MKLGAFQGMSAACTLYTLDSYDVFAAVLVDTDSAEEVTEKARFFENPILIKGNFGD